MGLPIITTRDLPHVDPERRCVDTDRGRCADDEVERCGERRHLVRIIEPVDIEAMQFEVLTTRCSIELGLAFAVLHASFRSGSVALPFIDRSGHAG